MTHTRTLVCLLLALCKCLAWAQNTNDYNEVDEPRPTLRKIHTLDDNCLKSVCIEFHYDSIDEVAFFDLKTEVHINDGESSYDIVNPRQYEKLIFANSTFARFPLNLFYAVGAKELDMRDCSIQLISWECFLMAEELTILLLSHNKLQRIDEMTFNYAEGLQYLFLDSNRLQTLVSESFKGLSKLHYLDLRHNQLELLPAGIFDYLTALQELHLADNRLHVIENELFLNNPGLYMLTLDGNRLQEIGEYAVKTQKNLVLLNLSDNAQLRTLVMTLQAQHLIASNCSLSRVNIYGPVQNVDMHSNQIMELYFSQPETLRMLNLRNNSLQQIASLTRATQLMALDLGDNPAMGELPAPWLANALERLDLGNTGLKQLPIEALAEQPNLTFLNVSENQLREINPLNFKYLKHLTHFDIHANDWNCYNLRMLMDLLLNPYQISYVHDKYDPEFPGEYMNGIACMYRIEEQQEQEQEAELKQDIATVQDQLTDASVPNANLQSAQMNDNAYAEVEKLRKELKAIVMFYEEKFSKTFEMISDLNARLAEFERMNATYWQHITITV